MKAKPIFLLLVFVFLFLPHSYAQEVHLKIQNIHTSNGVLFVGIFDSEENFKKEKSYLQLIFNKTSMNNKEMQVKIKLPPGTYGISVLDDENNDGKMNWKMLAIPREGFGFADYYHTGFKKPRFQNFKFSLQSDEIKYMSLKMRYF